MQRPCGEIHCPRTSPRKRDRHTHLGKACLEPPPWNSQGKRLGETEFSFLKWKITGSTISIALTVCCTVWSIYALQQRFVYRVRQYILYYIIYWKSAKWLVLCCAHYLVDNLTQVRHWITMSGAAYYTIIANVNSIDISTRELVSKPPNTRLFIHLSFLKD